MEELIMSNRVNLQFTKFINIGADGHSESESLGYRLYDDYETLYNNTYESIDELNEDINEETIFHFMAEHYPEIFIDAVRPKEGMYLNGVWIKLTDEAREYKFS